MKPILLFLFVITGFGLPIVNTAQGQQLQPYYSCDDNSDGIGLFQLSSKNDEVLMWSDPTLSTVAYFETFEDAENNINPLPDLYSNEVPFSQSVFGRATTISSGDFYIRNLPLVVAQNPIANAPPDLIFYSTIQYGRFNLFPQIDIIKGSQTNCEVYFYATQADAEAGSNSISYCYLSSETTEIWVRIQSNLTFCYNITSFICQVVEGDAPVSPTLSFADPNFKAKLLAAEYGNGIAYDFCFTGGTSAKIDLNSDGEIQQNEADNIYILQLSDANISSLDGIDQFKYLQMMRCDYNQLTTVDLSSLKYLSSLNVAGNMLTSLDLSHNPIYELSCYNNNLSYINMRNGTNSTFYPYAVQNWSNNPNLEFICADEGEIENITNTLTENNYSDVTIVSDCAALTNSEFTPFSVVSTIKIYPNPASDFVHIVTSEIMKHVSVFDLRGRMIREYNLSGNDMQIDTSMFTKGIYLVKVVTVDGTWTEKLFKN